MLSLLRLIYENVKEFDDKYRDRRSENYFLLSNPLHMIATVGLYYVFVKYIGPKFMEKRQAYELKNTMLVYNFLQVLFNALIAVYVSIASNSLYPSSNVLIFLKRLVTQLLTMIVYENYLTFCLYIILPQGTYMLLYEKPYPNYGCMMPHLSSNRWGFIEMHCGYAYFLLKVIDFMDTIFFVLRKRDKQITFLHLYHHIMVSVGSYIFMRYLPGGHGILMALFNVYVHTIMYFYYFMSALRPEMQESLWWKKHITQAQILQFLLLIPHFIRPLLFHRECSYSTVALLFFLTQNVIMTVMFLDFYYRTYIRKSSKIRTKNSEPYKESVNKIK